MRPTVFLGALLALAIQATPLASADPAPNLVQNPDFMLRSPDKKSLAAYDVAGDAKWQYLGDTHRDSRVAGVALRGTAGEVAQTLRLPVSPGRSVRWYHFSFRGLPDDGFKIANPDNLWMRVDYFTNDGKTSADGKLQHLYPRIQQDRWADDGKGHSPLLGWAFDGYPVYGPYEKTGVMAKDIQGPAALNGFNMEYDPDHGWHYHVTPGKFPYIIGGFWGVEDPRDSRLGPGGPR